MPTTIVSLYGYTPPIRYDGEPWTQAAIYESPIPNMDLPQSDPNYGVFDWTLIETKTLDPVDTDPESPSDRSFTTLEATLTNGMYQIIWLDGAGNQSPPSNPTRNVLYRPSVGELGAIMRGRTVLPGTGGNEQGSFTADTRPTGAQASVLIDQATEMVIAATGEAIPLRLYTQTKTAILYMAAQLVELSYYRNEVSKDQSAFAQYQSVYNSTLKSLLAAISDVGPAAVGPSWYSCPVLNSQQTRFLAMSKAWQNGKFDPSQLPADLTWPYGWGGIPEDWLPLILPGFDMFSSGDGLAFLEY